MRLTVPNKVFHRISHDSGTIEVFIYTDPSRVSYGTVEAKIVGEKTCLRVQRDQIVNRYQKNELLNP